MKSKIFVVLLSAVWVTFSVTAWSQVALIHKAEPLVRAQLAESLPLVGVDRVHQLGITGKGIGVFIIDFFDVNSPQDHGWSVMQIIQAVAPDADIWYCDATPLEREEIIPSCLDSLFERTEIYNRIFVMNMSFRSGMFFAPHSEPCDFFFGPQSAALRDFAQYRLPVASAGNDGFSNAILFPACLSDVVSVGASYDFSGQFVSFPAREPHFEGCSEIAVIDNLACYSNRAYFMDLVAPGTIISTPNNPNFGGTSAAAPIVSGVAALIFSVNPQLTPAQVRRILVDTADRAYDPVNDQYFPRVNAYEAIKSILPFSVPPMPLPRTNLKPIVSFTFSPADPYAGQDVTFNAAASYDPDGFIVNYRWSFEGDKEIQGSDKAIVAHRFEWGGSIIVCLSVLDNEGAESGDCTTVKVIATPAPPPSSPLARFDTNRSGYIEDPEFFSAIDQWLAGSISNDLFFQLVDAWIGHVRVAGMRRSDSTYQELGIFDLSGQLISTQACSYGPQGLRAQEALSKSDVPIGTYILVIRDCETGKTEVKKVAKMP